MSTFELWEAEVSMAVGNCRRATKTAKERMTDAYVSAGRGIKLSTQTYERGTILALLLESFK